MSQIYEADAYLADVHIDPADKARARVVIRANAHDPADARMLAAAILGDNP